MVKPDCQDELYGTSISFNYSDYDDVTYRIEVFTNISLLNLSIRDTIPQLNGLQFNATYVKDEMGFYVDPSEYEFTLTDNFAYWNFSYIDAGTHYFIYYCADVIGCGSYNATKIDESRGEKWFCSEQEAVTAGWRKALNCN
jgi:hypothetical protein